MNDLRIGIIGAGNMAQALISGLVKQGFTDGLTATDPSAEARNTVSAHYGIKTSADNHSAVSDADAIILAIKPQIMDTALASINETIDERQLVISIAAGITCRQISDGLNPQQPIIRAMPNTPALIGSGITGMVANQHVSDSQRQLAKRIMQSTGEALWLPQEAQIDAVTAVSGSGPAYFFLMIEAMAKAGEAIGLEPETAARLALVTGAGACEMALHSEHPPSELRRRVTSPGGTTAAALDAFEKGGFQQLVKTAIAAANQRGVELAGQS